MAKRLLAKNSLFVLVDWAFAIGLKVEKEAEIGKFERNRLVKYMHLHENIGTLVGTHLEYTVLYRTFCISTINMITLVKFKTNQTIYIYWRYKILITFEKSQLFSNFFTKLLRHIYWIIEVNYPLYQ